MNYVNYYSPIYLYHPNQLELDGKHGWMQYNNIQLILIQ